MRAFRNVFILSLGFWAASASAQSVIYSNGAPNNVSASNMTYFIGAEDFQFSSAQTVDAVRAWITSASQYAGYIAWMIYADNSGRPGALLNSGQASATFTATGAFVPQNGPGLAVSEMDFNITPFAAAANTRYWLGIRNGPEPSSFPPGNTFDWVFTGPNSSDISYFFGYGCCGAPTGWNPYNYSSFGLNQAAEHAFQLLSATNQCEVPAAEVTVQAGWAIAKGLPTGVDFTQGLTSSSGASFADRQIQEVDAMPGVDGCYVPGLPNEPPPFDHVTGSSWTVLKDNTWTDTIAQGVLNVQFYQTHSPNLPCTATSYQQMQMQCPNGGWANYGFVNRIDYTIDAHTVSVSRSGVKLTRHWP